VWGVLILGFGLEFVVSILDGHFGRALLALVGLAGLGALLLHEEDLKRRMLTVNPNWVFVSFVLFLLILVLSPFVEEQRWPFSYPDPRLVAENQRLVAKRLLSSRRSSNLTLPTTFATAPKHPMKNVLNALILWE